MPRKPKSKSKKPAAASGGPIDPAWPGAVKAAADKVIEPALKRLKEMERVGQHIASVREQMLQQETRVAEAKKDLEEERAEYNAMKKQFEELNDDLAKLATGGFAEGLPFDEAAAQAPAQPPAPTVATDEWRVYSLDKLTGLADADIAALKAGKIKTIGQLADYLNDPDQRLTDIKNIGEKRAERILDALAQYWERNPQPLSQPATTTEVPVGATAVATAEQIEVRRFEEMNVTETVLRGLVQPNLLTPIQTGAIPQVDTLLDHEGKLFIVLPSPIGRPEPFAMRAVEKIEPVDRQPKGHGVYAGAVIKSGEEYFKIGEAMTLLAS